MKPFLAVLALLALGATSKDDARRAYMVRLYDDPGMQKIVDLFRPKGYHVDVIHETKPSNGVAQYPVIEVGADIPAAEAIEVIRQAHDAMPTLRYVFIHEDPEMANVIFIGGSTSWISYKNLKPLTDKDFQDICTGEPSQITFHAKVRKFGL